MVPSTDDRKRRFEQLALPHLGAAYNLARWLTGDRSEAEDLVQEAYLRAWRYFDSFQGGDMRVWLLTIVRNCVNTWGRQVRSQRMTYTPEPPDKSAAPLWTEGEDNAESFLSRQADASRVNRMVAQLPVEYREVLLLREVEELSYNEIAAVIGAPVGTVMSRLSRARAALRRDWFAKESADEM